MSLRNFPDANTSITLDFLKGKKLDPRITFERASSATEIGEGTGIVNGQVFEFQEDVPRLTDKGLLIEESRTNYIPNSEDFTPNWIKTRTTFNASTDPAPDGTTNATFLAETAVNNYFAAYYNGTPTFTSASVSVYMKSVGGRLGTIFQSQQGSNTDSICAEFDLVNGTYQIFESSFSTFTYTDATMIPVGNGWYRCTLSYTAPVSQTKTPFYIGISDGQTPNMGTQGRPKSYQGDVNKGLLIWGGQIELDKTFPTSYIPTSGATATRAADLLQITGDDFTSWYNHNEGTLVAKYIWNGEVNVSRGQIGFWDGNTNGQNRWYAGARATAGGVFDNDARSDQGSGIPLLFTGRLDINDTEPGKTVIKQASALQNTTMTGSTNGSIAETKNDSDFLMPAVDRLCTGQFDGSATGEMTSSMYVQSVSYYPARVPDLALEALTS